MLDRVKDQGNEHSVLLEQNDDLTLVHRAQAGDKRAFELLILKYQHKVAYIAARYVRDNEEVKDVSQETFIRAFRGLRTFRGDCSFYTWLYTIATNAGKNHITRQIRRPTYQGLDIDDAANLQDSEGLKNVADPLSECLTDEVETTVKDAIRCLPHILQKTITLRELSGYTYEEIAQVMKCPVGTVRSRISRARNAIGEQLQPSLGDSESYRW